VFLKGRTAPEGGLAGGLGFPPWWPGGLLGTAAVWNVCRRAGMSPPIPPWAVVPWWPGGLLAAASLHVAPGEGLSPDCARPVVTWLAEGFDGGSTPWHGAAGGVVASIEPPPNGAWFALVGTEGCWAAPHGDCCRRLIFCNPGGRWLGPVDVLPPMQTNVGRRGRAPCDSGSGLVGPGCPFLAMKR